MPELPGQAPGPAPEDAGAAGATLLHEAGERIETLLTASAAGGVMAQERAEELVRTVVDLYGTGLRRMLDLLFDAGRLDEVALDALTGDELVRGLLLVHGLHPDDLPTRVAKALDEVRPYLGSHGGDVELVEISVDGVVRLRLKGSCDGCASSATTLELAVEGAVRDAAPEVTAIEVEQPTVATVIPIASLRLRTGAAEPVASAGWHAVFVDDIDEGRAQAREIAGVPVIVARIGRDLFAFRDRCPVCHGALAGASLQRRAGGRIGDAVLCCGTCGHHYEVRNAGAGLDTDERLEPLPLLARNGRVEIAVSGKAVPGVATL